MAIFITGDIHGDPTRFSTDNFPIGKELTKNDYVIILGDFGLIWRQPGHQKEEKWWIKWLNKKPWTTLFIDGNHENYDRLNTEFPIEEWNGGKVHKIADSIFHLMRGECFIIDGFKFLALGGAESHDIKDGVLEVGDPRIKSWMCDYTKLFRINHLSWWKEEVPSDDEIKNATQTIANNNGNFDFILSHEAPVEALAIMRSVGRYGYGGRYTTLSHKWQEFNALCNYQTWFFGHYHEDYNMGKFYCLYERITQITN